MVKVRIIGADIPGLLSRLEEADIELHNVNALDLLTVELHVKSCDKVAFNKLIKKCGCSSVIVKDDTLICTVRSLSKRYFLILAILFLLFMTCWLPGRVLFVSIIGNENVSTERILQQAEMCGIYFGAKRSAVRSETLKNNLLASLPELSWAGVNTRGCTAIIQVQEQPETDQDGDASCSSIYASRDGVILTLTATSGYSLCHPGQAVIKGQLLVSGSINDGALFKRVRSNAEIFAQTTHNMTAVTPLDLDRKGENVDSFSCYSIIIGKKRINLSKDSRISYARYDKMNAEYRLVLPGGFTLPVSVVVDTYTEYDYDQCLQEKTDANNFLGEYADMYLSSLMVSGRITDRLCCYRKNDNLAVLEVKYICVEMIGRERPEEFDIHYGKD